MRKLVMLLALFVLFIFPITAQAASERFVVITPDLNFEGSEAVCTVSVAAVSNDIQLTIKLWQGTSCLTSWKVTGNGPIGFNERFGVAKGKSYTLTVDAIIDGVAKPRQSCTKSC